ncbi:hypothetical protein D9C73_018264 [Collichthys lucidus]|uniref:Uncharacterized protein n=1 Tax=Collichthys lucidus TaxID=240159 RepID=A0A4U5VAW4_COLLU|nr:hypothetical protein D9C73_018264 [Collichthys lucidus]
MCKIPTTGDSDRFTVSARCFSACGALPGPAADPVPVHVFGSSGLLLELMRPRQLRPRCLLPAAAQ